MFRTTLLVAALLASAPALAGDPVAAIRGADPNSDAWDDVVTDALRAFDTNGSGEVDNGKEMKAIGCSVWQAINDGVRAKWDGSGARVIYGFKKGFIWVGYAWGLSEKGRKTADKAMEKCGIE